MNLSSRQNKQWYFLLLCRLVTFIAVATLGVLLFHIVKEGFDWLDADFINNFPSRFPEKAGIKSALYGSIWLITMTAFISAPLGIATAFYLEEYAPKKNYMRWIQINISNLFPNLLRDSF